MQKSNRKRLFTPGPLNTKASTREAMQHDMGSREKEFIQVIRRVRENLLDIAGLDTNGPFTTVLMQGPGTFSIEAAIGTFAPTDKKLLLLVNGAYGRRMVDIANRLGIEFEVIEFEETEAVCVRRVDEYLKTTPDISLVSIVHCETTTGILNPIETIGQIVAQAGCYFMVDAMSSFGGIKINFDNCHIDCLISSANKCLESTPGLSFVIAKKTLLKSARGQARSLSLDLLAQWEELERSGQFRFTPPTHVIMALDQALETLNEEGGVTTRFKRYQKAHQLLMSEMDRLGFESPVMPSLQSPIISTFIYPQSTRFKFDQFYEALADYGLFIYPGKISSADCFRIGTIGDLNNRDFAFLIEKIEEVLILAGVPLPIVRYK